MLRWPPQPGRLLRLVPSVLVATLVVLVARAQTLPNANLNIVPGQCPNGNCGSVTGMADKAPEFPNRFRVIQPLSVTCLTDGYAFRLVTGTATPLTGGFGGYAFGEPTFTTATYLLHRVSITPVTGWTSYGARRPIVTDVAPGLLSHVFTTLALDVQAHGPIDPGERFTFPFEPAAPVSAPAGFETDGITIVPLPGPNGVLAHELCVVTSTARPPRVVQHQPFVDAPIVTTATPSVHEALQRFQLPVSATLQWIEFALPDDPVPGFQLDMEILDPPVNIPFPEPGPLGWKLDSTRLNAEPGSYSAPSWVPSLEIVPPVRLEAGREYWLAARLDNVWNAGVTTSTTSFDGVWVRDAEPSPWTQLPASLSFRLIGVHDQIGPPPACAGQHLQGQILATTLFEPTGTALAQRITIPPGQEVRPAIAFSSPQSVTGTIRLSDPGSRPFEPTYPLYSEPLMVTFVPGFLGWAELDPERPIVLESVTGTAQSTGFPAYIGLEFTTATVVAGLDENPLHSTIPYFERGPGGWTQGPTETAIAHFVCGGALDPNPPLVVQQVVRTTDVVPTTTAEIIQTFTVPEGVELEWIEFAVPSSQPEPPAPLEVRIIDPGPDPVPGPGTLITTATTTFVPAPGAGEIDGPGQWVPSGPLGQNELQPGRIYWLAVMANKRWTPALDRVSGPAQVLPAASTQGAGDFAFYRRDGSSGPFTAEPDLTLSFRMIGRRTGTTGIPAPAAGVHGLRLSVGPTPFARETAFRWAGGTGRVRIEVTDVRGRTIHRVADAGEGLSGSWIWNGRDRSGRRVAPGVYFVRVRDGAGALAVRRAVFRP